jgi:hypothetical protein
VFPGTGVLTSLLGNVAPPLLLLLKFRMGQSPPGNVVVLTDLRVDTDGDVALEVLVLVVLVTTYNHLLLSSNSVLIKCDCTIQSIQTSQD